MKITVESTKKIVTVNGGVDARIWEGKSETGIPVICFVTRVAVPADADQEQFKKELRECAAPSAEATSFPLWMAI